MSMKSTEESQISTDKSQVAVYFNDISQDQLSQSFDFGTCKAHALDPYEVVVFDDRVNSRGAEGDNDEDNWLGWSLLLYNDYHKILKIRVFNIPLCEQGFAGFGNGTNVKMQSAYYIYPTFD
ncbi:hypothetical protein YC2023_026745 [Brassica napus]